MTSGVILSFFFSCHEFSWRSRHGEWVNITLKWISAIQYSCIVSFGAKLNIALIGVRSRVRIPRKTANLMLLTLYFLLNLAYFFVKVLSDN